MKKNLQTMTNLFYFLVFLNHLQYKNPTFQSTWTGNEAAKNSARDTILKQKVSNKLAMSLCPSNLCHQLFGCCHFFCSDMDMERTLRQLEVASLPFQIHLKYIQMAM